MPKWIFIGLCVTLVLCSVMFHELGHGVLMRANGVEVTEISFGVGPTLLRVPWNALQSERQASLDQDVYFVIRPLPLGAYVMPNDSGPLLVRQVPIQNRNTMFLIGPIINIAFCFLCLLVILLLGQTTKRPLTKIPLFRISFVVVVLSVLAIYLPAPLLISVPLTVMGLGILVVICLRKMQAAVAFLLGNSEKKTARRRKSSNSFTKEQRTLPNVLLLSAGISFSLACLNLLPLVVFDGGKVWYALFETYSPGFAKYYTTLSFLGFLAIMGSGYFQDIKYLIQKAKDSQRKSS